MHGIIWRLDQIKTDLRAYKLEEIVQVQTLIRRFLAMRRVSEFREARREDQEREERNREIEERRMLRKTSNLTVPAHDRQGSVSHRGSHRTRREYSAETLAAMASIASSLGSVGESGGVENESSEDEVWCGGELHKER